MARSAYVPATLGFIAAMLVFGICVRNDLVYDDVLLIQMDDRLDSPHEWWRFFTESYNGGVDNLYRPLISLSYAIQRWLHGGLTWPFFAVNIVLHASCAAAVAELCRRLVQRVEPSRAMSAACIAGLLFAVHPVHSEVVASVVGRCESLCTLALLAALILFTQTMTVSRAFAIGCCGVVAVLSKEQGLLLPALLLLQRWLAPPPAAIYPADSTRGNRILVLLVSWAWAAYILFRETKLKFWWDRSLLDWTQQPLIFSGTTDRLLWPLAIAGRYAKLLVIPDQLSLDYGYAVTQPQLSVHDGFLWLGIEATLVCLILLVLVSIKRQKLLLFLLLAFGLTYTLISNGPTLIGTIMGERLIYLPSVFLIVVFAIALSYLRRTGWFICIVLFGLGAWRSFDYVSRFDDRLAFYRYSVANQPQSTKLRILLVSELLNRKLLDEASDQSTKARQVGPLDPDLWFQGGQVAFARLEYDEADALLTEAIRLHRNPNKAVMLLQQVRAARAATQPATRPK